MKWQQHWNTVLFRESPIRFTNQNVYNRMDSYWARHGIEYTRLSQYSELLHLQIHEWNGIFRKSL